MTSKYHREIKPGVEIDVYDVLTAFCVTNPADAHAVKKLLMPGQRGSKDGIQDREEAIVSIRRAIEIEREANKIAPSPFASACRTVGQSEMVQSTQLVEP